MKKSATIRPVSRNAYARFVHLITLVVTDPRKCAAMLKALDRYLAGDRDTYAAGLTADCAMAFEMLRFDIDLAIDRSAKARMRARRNKGGEQPVGQPSGDTAKSVKSSSSCHGEAVCADSTLSAVENTGSGEKTDTEGKTGFVRPLTRRQRRMRERWEKPKMRWGKL